MGVPADSTHGQGSASAHTAVVLGALGRLAYSLLKLSENLHWALLRLLAATCSEQGRNSSHAYAQKLLPWFLQVG